MGQPSAKAKPRNSRADTIEVLRQHRRVLIDLGRYAAEAVDFRAFADDAVVRISAALEIEHVKLLRYRADHNDLFMEAGIGWDPGIVGSATFATDLASPVGRAFQIGQPILIENLARATDFRSSEVLRAHGIVSLLNVPILTDGAVWGIIEVDSTVPRAFSEDTVSFMLGVAALVGLVIRRTDAANAREATVSDAAREVLKRELQLQEMQHRVKNNFQIILSMIELRKPSLTPENRDLVNKLSDGIMAMSLAHDQLSPARNGEVLELGAYLRALASAFAVTMETILIEVKSDDVNVTIEQAVPIGLIVNELITNSIKHAFGRDGGAIRVEVHATGRDGMAVLAVSDNGRGLGPKGDDQGSGQRLVRALADQIRGELTQTSTAAGTTVRLRFTPRAR